MRRFSLLIAALAAAAALLGARPAHAILHPCSGDCANTAPYVAR